MSQFNYGGADCVTSETDVALLLREIRSDAIHDSVELITILRKCKVLSCEIRNEELNSWSAWESLGYPDSQPVPPYRIWPLRFHGTFTGRFGRKKEEVIPTDFLPSFVGGYEFRQGVLTLEDHLQRAENGTVRITAGDLHLAIGRSMIRGYDCVCVTAEINAARLAETLYAVRDRILNITSALLQETQLAQVRYRESRDTSKGQVKHSGLIPYQTVLRDQQEIEEAWARARRGERV